MSRNSKRDSCNLATDRWVVPTRKTAQSAPWSGVGSTRPESGISLPELQLPCPWLREEGVSVRIFTYYGTGHPSAKRNRLRKGLRGKEGTPPRGRSGAASNRAAGGNLLGDLPVARDAGGAPKARQDQPFSAGSGDSPPSGGFRKELRDGLRRRRFFCSPEVGTGGVSICSDSSAAVSSGGWGGGVFRVAW